MKSRVISRIRRIFYAYIKLVEKWHEKVWINQKKSNSGWRKRTNEKKASIAK